MASAKELILEKLRWTPHWLAAHEMHIEGHSENSVCSRLPEMENAGIVKSRFREGKNFKEWSLQKAEGDQLVMF
jgi:predicted transcriptional regulator